MVPLNMTYLHCLQHSLFEHLFNLYYSANGSQSFTWHNYIWAQVCVMRGYVEIYVAMNAAFATKMGVMLRV